MKIHTSFTKVTPLSKTLALILFILFPFLGFYFGMQYQQALDIISMLPKISPVVSSPIQPKNTSASILDYFISYQLPKGWNKSIDEKTGAIILASSEFAHSTKQITGMEITISKNGKGPTPAQKQMGIASPTFVQTIAVGANKGFMTYSSNPQPMYTITVTQGTDMWLLTFSSSKTLEKALITIRDSFLSSVKFSQPIGL